MIPFFASFSVDQLHGLVATFVFFGYILPLVASVLSYWPARRRQPIALLLSVPSSIVFALIFAVLSSEGWVWTLVAVVPFCVAFGSVLLFFRVPFIERLPAEATKTVESTGTSTAR